MSELSARYQTIQLQIAKNQKSPATLIAVSKTQPIGAIRALYELGHRDFGENYVQELVAKAEELGDAGFSDIRWHFIGHLQTNKVKALMPHVFGIHTVDSLKLAEEISKRWTGHSPLSVWIEVNLDGEDSKSGISPDGVVQFVQEVSNYSNLSIEGLMSIPQPRANEAEMAAAYSRLRNLEKNCRPHSRGHLSMGMSQDYPCALREGATEIRVGTALFGARIQK